MVAKARVRHNWAALAGGVVLVSLPSHSPAPGCGACAMRAAAARRLCQLACITAGELLRGVE
eukprot:1195663-Prorocentrum_minimum.AAC.9